MKPTSLSSNKMRHILKKLTLINICKFIWTLLCFNGFCYYFYDITNQYIKYQTITNIEFLEQFEPHSVSICFDLLELVKYYKVENQLKKQCEDLSSDDRIYECIFKHNPNDIHEKLLPLRFEHI